MRKRQTLTIPDEGLLFWWAQQSRNRTTLSPFKPTLEYEGQNLSSLANNVGLPDKFTHNPVADSWPGSPTLDQDLPNAGQAQ